ncbi:MAG TPA: 3-phosphoshikimate 1-carboxyvinyltransferase, partial [Microbacterium sp.]|nr:3-phosphoshikimate 1-carboxyvinyltransferase [Microbacterium sp.]
SPLHGFDVDLSVAGELAPTIVGLAALASGPSTISGIGHIRLHETDRIRALVDGINDLGGDASELPDGIRVIPRQLHGGLWKSRHDHRMATTGALLGLAVPGIEIDDLGVTAKTLPQFEELWNAMLSGADRIG